MLQTLIFADVLTFLCHGLLPKLSLSTLEEMLLCHVFPDVSHCYLLIALLQIFNPLIKLHCTLMHPIFTLSNARLFYSSRGECWNGLKQCIIIVMYRCMYHRIPRYHRIPVLFISYIKFEGNML
jgi:hypothetical protein